MTRYLGIDLGATNFKFGLVDQNGRVISRGRFPVQGKRGPERFMAEMTDRLSELIDGLDTEDRPAGIGISAAGLLDPVEGVLISSPNLPGWRDLPLAGELEKALGLPAKLENDGNMHALGEWLAGAGRGSNNMIMFALGTGVGGGLVLDRRIWNGSFGTSGEAGHIVVEPEGPPCGCGNRGCLEQYASATAMARQGRELLALGRKSLYRGDPGELTSAALFDLAAQGDAMALEVYDRVGWAMGVVLSDVFNLLGLQGVVIGGGAGPAYRFFEARMRGEFASRVFTVDPEKVFFREGALGDDAPLVGAAALFLPEAER